MRRKKLFISYSHKDVCWLGRMREHLAVLELEGLLDLFEDTQIGAGEDWYARLDQEMREARIALLLISASFLTSAFIRTHIGSVEYDQFMVCRIYNADHSDYERIVLLGLYARSQWSNRERSIDPLTYYELVLPQWLVHGFNSLPSVSPGSIYVVQDKNGSDYKAS